MLTRHLKRGFAALLSLWFLLVVIEPESVHSCPVHASAAAASTTVHSHQMHGASKGGTEKSSHAICSCPGDCAASSFGALPSISAALPSFVVIQAENARGMPSFNAPARVDLLLPFALGPPASSIG